MPRLNLAQWTGIAVTVIVVLGNDLDVIYAVPLGLFASTLATVFSELPNLCLPALRFAKIHRPQ
jgi:hypothetical protein